MSDKPSPDRLLADLDPDQRAAVRATSGPVCIIAGAGTGKTRTLTRRVAYAAATGAADPRRTLLITFTRDAAAEMRERLAALGVTGVTAATFHAAALRQVAHFHPRVYGTPAPEVLDSTFQLVARAAKPILTGAERYAPTRDLVAEIEWAKVRMVTPDGYVAAAAAGGRPCPIDPVRFVRLYAAYEERKAAAGRMDFADLLGRLVAMLEGHPDVAAEVYARYAHFSVDEYQDTSPLAERLLGLWLGDRREIAVVGDPEQTIYTFSGATSGFLTTFRRRFPDATVVTLRTDYRSSPEIVAVANRLGAAPGAGGGRLVSPNPSGPAPVYAAVADETEEQAAIVAEVRLLVAAGVPETGIGILVRMNAAVPPIEAALTAAGIGYRVLGEGFFARSDVRRVAADLAEKARRTPDADARATLVGILRSRFGYDPDAPVVGAEAAGRAAAAETLLVVAAGFRTVADLAAEIERRTAAESAGTTTGVEISTIHRAKGLEWDAVLLPGWEETNLPIRQALGDPAAIAEERRLAYVAVTRARRHLWVSSAATRLSSSGRPVAQRPSRFVAAAGLAAARQAASRSVPAATVTKPKAKAAPIEGPFGAALVAWRRERAAADAVPAYVVMPNETIAAIVTDRPTTIAALRRVRGMGPARTERYGEEILRVIGGLPAA